jgi:hypothetical protein
MSFPLMSFFLFGPIGFPSKMMPCKSQFDYFGLGPSSKGLGTNLKFLTNRNAQFHWTLFLGPLSKVAPNIEISIKFVKAQNNGNKTKL